MSLSYCTYCGQGHPIALCPSTWGGSAAQTNLRCAYCGSDKHTAEFCRQTAAGDSNRRANPNGTFLD